MNYQVKNIIDAEIDPAFARRAKIIAQIAESRWKKKGEKILDIGCGRGWYEKMLTLLLKEVEITAIDQNEKYIEKAKRTVYGKGVNFLKVKASKLPFRDNSFDGIICTEVLEHVSDDAEVIKEITRVLKPGKVTLITVPHKNYPFAWDPLNWILEKILNTHVPSTIWWLAGIWADHLRLYKEEDLMNKLKRGGLKPLRVFRVTKHCLLGSHFLLYGIGKNLVEFGLMKDFDRFNYDQKNLNKISFAKKIIQKWDKRNDTERITKTDSFVNLVIEAVKEKTF